MNAYDALWLAVASAALSAICSALLASGLVAYLSQSWIEKRERRNRRDQLRLELYHDLIALVLKNEIALASRTQEAKIMPEEHQAEQISFIYRLRLLSPKAIQELYEVYKKLVFLSIAQEPQYRPDRDKVDKARDALLEAVCQDANS